MLFTKKKDERHLSRKRSLFIRDTVLLTTLNFIGKTLGFSIPLFLALWFGGTAQTDSFYFSYSLVLFLANILAQSLATVIVPYWVKLRAKNLTSRFTGNVFLVTTCLLTGLTLIIGLSWQLQDSVNLASIDFFDLIKRLTSFTLELLPLLFLVVWSAIFEGVLQAEKHFFITGLSQIVRSLFTLIIIWLFKNQLGLGSVVLAVSLGELARLILLWLRLYQEKLFSLQRPWRLDKGLADFFFKAGLQALAFLAVGLNPLIDKAMAAGLGEGNISALYYGEKLFSVPIALLTSGVMVTLLSYWSNSIVRVKRTDFIERIRQTACKARLFSLGIMAIAFLLVEPVLSFIFQSAALTKELITKVSVITLMYFTGFLPALLTQVYAQALIVFRRTGLILLVASSKVILNIVFNLLLVQIWGVAGIALATSVVSWLGCLMVGLILEWVIRKQPLPAVELAL